jgi:hypothetical protein
MLLAQLTYSCNLVQFSFSISSIFLCTAENPFLLYNLYQEQMKTLNITILEKNSNDQLMEIKQRVGLCNNVE